MVDTSAYATELGSELVRYVRSRGSRRKVLFGSNFPMLTQTQCLADLPTLDLDDETRHLYLDGNARRVFGLNPT